MKPVRSTRRSWAHLLLLAAMATLAPLAIYAQIAANNTYVIDLPTVLRLARADNLDVKLAQERINEAKNNHSAAVAKFLPWVTAGVSFRSHEGRTQAVDGTMLDVDKQSTSVGPTITAQMDIGDALFTTLAARQYIAAANAALAAQEQDSALSAASGYFNLLQAKAVLEANREALATSVAYEQQLQGGVEAGVIFKGDLLRVQTQTQRYQAGIVQAQQQQRAASARLAELLHLDPVVVLIPQDNELLPIELAGIGGVRNQAATDLITQALNNRAELQQGQAQVQAAREAQKNARFGPFIPSVGAQAFLGALSGGSDGDSGHFSGSRDYYIGLNWRFGPGGLFDFTRSRAATSKLHTAELGLEKTTSSIQRQVIEAQARVQSAAGQMTATRSALGNATETLRLTRERKQLGVGIVLEDIQAQQELVRTRTEYLSAITEYNKAQYELGKALGSL
ncbi:MAG: TolC family protein [Steroidobacteraceae bacterium]